MKKKVLVVGTGSYIGTSFVKASSNLFDIAMIDSLKPLTIDNFRGFDSVIHVAGIAHVSKKRSMESLYYKVNRDLAIQSATLAKKAGVKQFIFMSSMIVYGGDYRIGKPKIITAETEPHPEDFYGESKLEADLFIQKMDCDSFHTLVIRTPMVYGKGCKGNYPKMLKLAAHTWLLPKIENRRTVINIDCLVGYFQKYINGNIHGLVFPRDSESFVTYRVMMDFRTDHGKKTHLTKIFNPFIVFLSFFFVQFRKLFGTKIYSDSLPSI